MSKLQARGETWLAMVSLVVAEISLAWTLSYFYPNSGPGPCSHIVQQVIPVPSETDEQAEVHCLRLLTVFCWTF